MFSWQDFLLLHHSVSTKKKIKNEQRTSTKSLREIINYHG